MNNHIYNNFFRLFNREKSKLFLSFLSLFIGALVLGTVMGITSSVRDSLWEKSKELLGGDILIQQNFPIDEKNPILQKLKDKGALFDLKMQTGVSFSDKSGQKSLLGAVKTVSPNYPLYGKLDTSKGGLKPSEKGIFVEKAFIERLNLKIGDSVFVGNIEFIIEDTIVKEPDSFASGFNFGPRVIMSDKGWERTGISKDASRIGYYLAVKVSENQTVPDLILEAEKFFRANGALVSTAKSGPTQLLNILNASQRFFLTVTILTLFLVMVNVRANLTYILNYFTRTIAIFRVLGMNKTSVLSIFTLLVGFTGILGGISGAISGNLLIRLIIPQLEKVLGTSLFIPSLFQNTWLIVLFTFSIAILSSLPILIRILKIEPKMILNQTFDDKSQTATLIRELINSLLLGVGFFVITYLLTESLKVAFLSVLIIVVIFSFFILLIRGVISFLYKNRFNYQFHLRSIINFLKNHGIAGEIGIASLTLGLTGIFCISIIQYNISQNLRGEMPIDLPNLYVIDIQEDQKSELKTYIKDLEIFSNIRARFMKVDEKNLQTDEKADPEFRREFNLTYRTDLLKGETVIEGTWHGKNEKNAVSVEKKFAERAGIKIGSTLEFLVQGIPLTAKVTSFRSIEEVTRGMPFFFLVFSPDLLEEAPKSYFGYTNIPTEKIPDLQNRLAKKFPNVSAIPTSEIINTVNSVTDTIISSVLAISIPALILGIILIFSMMANSARERFKDLILFKVFGSGKNELFKIFVIEGVSFAFIASILALTFSIAVSYALNIYLFKFPNFYFNYQLLFLVGLIILFSLAFSAYLVRKLFTRSSLALLRA